MSEATVGFKRVPCPECQGTGELRIESENINEHFEVEKQTVITNAHVAAAWLFCHQAAPDPLCPSCRKIAPCNQSNWKQEG